jgi:threonine/homoserine/homoserine lactone efflux protein
MGIHDLWLFVIAGLLLNITPGPDMALVIARSARSGARAGSAAALGIGAGCFVHIAAAAVGVSALIMASATAFAVLKWVGAAYLVYVGMRMLLGAGRSVEAVSEARGIERDELRSAFLQGFLTNALNPKVAVFFLAFLPQFIAADAPSKAAAFLILGCVFNVTGTAWNLAVAWFAGRVGASGRFGWLRAWLERTLGALFVAAGIRLALPERL